LLVAAVAVVLGLRLRRVVVVLVAMVVAVEQEAVLLEVQESLVRSTLVAAVVALGMTVLRFSALLVAVVLLS
jgi:hypothetical protein